jgi:hypothetical protein
MTDVDEEKPPLPPVRNDSTRNMTYSLSSSASTSGSMSSGHSTSSPPPPLPQSLPSLSLPGNHTTNNGSSMDFLNKPLPKTPDEEEGYKKKNKVKQTKGNRQQQQQKYLSSYIQNIIGFILSFLS